MLVSNIIFSQISLTEIKPYEELTKEELFQIGEIAAINSYQDEVSNTVLGFFLGSLVIDIVAYQKSIPDVKYKRWTKKLELDKKIIYDDWFIEGFVTKRLEQKIISYRKGRVYARAASVAVLFFVLPEIVDEID